MSDTLRVDHIVILVEDLPAAVADYARLGFTVVPGGEHEDGQSHNALIGLADGSYIELIAFRGRSVGPAGRRSKEKDYQRLRGAGRSPGESRVLSWQACSDGFVDLALLPHDLEGDLARAKERGLPIEGPFAGGRRRPDGKEVRWQLGIPASFDVPFLCADVTARSLRVPGSEAAQHANGAVGVDQIGVAVVDLDASVSRWQALLGTPPQPADSRRSGAQFQVGGVSVHLLSGAADPAREALEQHGEGPCSLRLRGDREESGQWGPQAAHGARISLVPRA